ncbi:Fc.00g094500.m01.CDS01 [Cosmosporella sp. VM-42]
MSRLKEEDEIYDVLVVGAGPCGLAVAARLREHTPAALFTDEEHRRYHFIGKYGKKVTLKHVKSGRITNGKHTPRPEYKMLVLDSSAGTWLGRWNRLFQTYDISHLRSLMIWHCDPQDRDALLAHAWANGRTDEMVEIKHCVGKELSKHAKKKTTGRQCGAKQAARVAINMRERDDYYTPSTPLFRDHCEKIAERYKLSDDIIRNESVEHIDYDVVRGVSIDDEKLFTVATNGVRRYARAVILAVGPANEAKIPRIPSMPNVKNLPQTCHSMHINEFPAQIVQDRIAARRQTNILVVGGGLTSAQLSDLAIRKGVTTVWHIMRSGLRIKAFDVDLEWMGKYKNAEQARFWSADSDEERLEMIKAARGGGSITPLFHKRLKKHLATKQLRLFTETHLVDAKFHDKDGLTGWAVKMSPPIEGLPFMDYIYFATGIQTDFRSLPYLQTMLDKYPIPGHGGFPCINDDLMWNAGVPLFMTGRLAALRLGPAAPNLGGAKIGAERIAWAIEDLIPHPAAIGDDGSIGFHKNGQDIRGYLSGHGNMYSSLGCE